MDAYIVKIKKKRNNKREVVRCEKTEKSHDGIRQLVICLQIKLPAELLNLFLFYFYFFIQEEHL